MDRLLTFEGRQPIWLDDIDFLQDSFAGEIARLVEGLVPADNIPDVVILKGCEKELVDSTVTFNSGIIYCKGEILRVTASSANLSPDYVFNLVQEVDSSGDRILQDTEENVSCYIKRSAVISRLKVSSTNILGFYSKSIRLADLLEQKYGKAEEVLYEGGGESDGATSHFKLVRNGSSFTLIGNFNGLDLDFEFDVSDKYASEHLGDSHLNGEDWNTGKSYGVAAIYIEDDGGNKKYICAPVCVYAEPARDFSYTTLYVRIFAPSTTNSNWSNGNINVKGGFTMNLNTK